MTLRPDSIVFPRSDQHSAAHGVLLGCPYEESRAFRRGAQAAPGEIRRFLTHISSFHPDTACDLNEWMIVDQGDIVMEEQKESAVFSALEETAFSVFREKRFLMTLGGTGSVSYPLIKAAMRAYPDLRVISLDAHTGMETGGKEVGHDNLFTALFQCGLERGSLYQWGARVGSREAADMGQIHHFYDPPKVKRGILEQMHKLYPYPIYLTLDIDVMDPPYAPGSGHPVYGGIGTAELFETIALLQSLNIVGMDLKEIVPAFDPAGITEILGATIVKEAFVHFLPKIEKKP